MRGLYVGIVEQKLGNYIRVGSKRVSQVVRRRIAIGSKI